MRRSEQRRHFLLSQVLRDRGALTWKTDLKGRLFHGRLSRKKNLAFDLMPDYSSRKQSVRNTWSPTPESAINPISIMKSGRKVRGREKAKIIFEENERSSWKWSPITIRIHQDCYDYSGYWNFSNIFQLFATCFDDVWRCLIMFVNRFSRSSFNPCCVINVRRKESLIFLHGNYCILI